MEYKIKQIKDLKNCDYAFEHYDWCKDKINLNDYKIVYESVIIPNEGPIENTLDELFEIFNINRPKDFTGRSLSVSDIVELNGDDYFCDAFGWVKL